ncbi:MAG: sterol desaturase family protein [Gemmatimonadetes bacterium]|nr:sterol desaturase family protein [Gemmatimonadota bacterium]
MDVIKASIPFFFALIGLELLIARVRHRPLYRLNDSISDLSCGILSQLAGIFISLGTIFGFGWVSTHWSLQRVLDLPGWIDRSPFAGGGLDLAALASWSLVFVLDDFAYYWMHRVSHVSHLLWAGHVVHHSSEEFNLTVALRQSSLHGFMSWVFYLPLAVLGVPVTMWVVCHALSLVYQFWIHTRAIRTMGPIEVVMNTPSHHRVHHGVNPEYQDKNYAGTFIVWDRLFGTFEPERTEPVYGLTKPLASWNPLWANLHVFRDIWRSFSAAREFVKYEPPVPPPLKTYALVQFVGVLAGSLLLLDAVGRLPLAHMLAGVFYVALSLGNIGGILEGRTWAGQSEVARMIVAAVVAIGLAMAGALPIGAAGMLALAAAGSAYWMVRLRVLLTSSDVRAVVVM